MKITIPGNIASKKNSKQIIKVGKRHIPIPSKAYKRWEKNSRDYIKSMNLGNPTEDLISVCAIVYYKGPVPDLSGACESVGDCCESVLWVNDRQIKSWDGSRLYHDKVNPRVEITVELFKE